MYLLDTNVCLDFLLTRNVGVEEKIGQHFGTLRISAITAAELQVGNRHSQDRDGDARRLEIFLSGLSIEPFDAAAAMHYGTLLQTVAFQRRSFDRLIAAHALSLGITLVTNNERDFAAINGLRVENWTVPGDAS